jgi:regulator of protease activity HflC (stomatin/prohibitin superfamily)
MKEEKRMSPPRQTLKEVRQMEGTMLTVKFVVLYGFEVFVVAVVGATVIAGLYQLIRSQVRVVVGRVRERRALAPAGARRS